MTRSMTGKINKRLDDMNNGKTGIVKESCPQCGHRKSKYKASKDSYKCTKCKTTFFKDEDEVEILETNEEKKNKSMWRKWLKI